MSMKKEAAIVYLLGTQPKEECEFIVNAVLEKCNAILDNKEMILKDAKDSKNAINIRDITNQVQIAEFINNKLKDV